MTILKYKNSLYKGVTKNASKMNTPVWGIYQTVFIQTGYVKNHSFLFSINGTIRWTSDGTHEQPYYGRFL